MSKHRLVYYGGSFDPIHHGHEMIISWLSQNFEQVVVQASNNWTKDQSLFPLAQREAALRELVKTYPNVIVRHNDGNILNTSTYLIVEELSQTYREKPWIAIGSDNTRQLNRWKYWSELNNKYSFCVFNRANYSVQYEMKNSWVIDIGLPSCSSTEIRQRADQTQVPERIRAIYDWSLLKGVL